MNQGEGSTVLLHPSLPPVRNGTYPSSGIMTTTAAEDPIKLWLKIGAIDKLEQAVLDGYGRHLLGKTSRIPKINKFLTNVPLFQTKIDKIHDAVVQGDKDRFIDLMEHEKLALCRDHNGASPLHKAIMHGQKEIVIYLLNNHSAALHSRDHQGRSPLHYAALVKDDGEMYNILLEAGADTIAVDNKGRRASAYLREPEMSMDSLNKDSQPRKLRAPRRLIMRAQLERKFRERSAKPLVTKAGLRHLIKNGDKDKLEQVIIYGYGNKLLGENAHDVSMATFLNNVPTLLEKINQLHRAVVRGKLEEVMQIMDTSEDLSDKLTVARDQMGATPLHKAVMYGHSDIAKFFVKNYPKSLTVRDREGRTALHYAAAVDKNLYKKLMSSGVDHTIPDIRGKQAEYYLQRPDEMDLHLLVQKANRLNAMYNATTNTRLRQWSPTRKLSTVMRSRTVGNETSRHRTRLEIIQKRRSRSQEVIIRNNKTIQKSKNPSPTLRGEIDKKKMSKSLDRMNKKSQERFKNEGAKVTRGRAEKRKIPKVKETSWGNKIKKDNNEITDSRIKKWINNSDFRSLERVVLEGHGERLLSYKDLVSDENMKEFMDVTVPNIIEKMYNIDKSVYDGDVVELTTNLNNRKLAFAKNNQGSTPLQRAIIHQYHDIIEYILKTFPESIEARDAEGRTAIHYASVVEDDGEILKLLIKNGANIDAKDSSGSDMEAYRNGTALIDLTGFEQRPSNLLTSMETPASNNSARVRSSTYSHANAALNRPGSNLEYINNVVEEGEVEKLEKLLLDGHGAHLIGKTSWSETAKNFLDNVPDYLEDLRLFRESVVQGNDEQVKDMLSKNSKLGHARYQDGTTALHLATKNRQASILALLLENFSDAIHYKDINGCTPLHYAGMVKDDDIYMMLVDAGSDQNVQNLKGQTPEYCLNSTSRQSSGHRNSLLEENNGSKLSLRSVASSKSREEVEVEAEEQSVKNDEEAEEQSVKKDEEAEEQSVKNDEESEEQSVKNDEESEVEDQKNVDDAEEQSEVQNEDEEKDERQIHEYDANVTDENSPEPEDYLDEKIREWIETGDLQRLEHVVIAGQGGRLVGASSSDEQVNEFLQLVPAYMGKIREVHSAVRRGDLNEVKDKLNRKRFALSRDYLGASPLHLAILYEKSDVMQYIMETYPETLDGPDNMGRTSLHYAGALSDGGALYRLLLSAGANPDRKDKLDNTAFDYLNNPGTLTVEDLLEVYKKGERDPRDPSVQMWERPPTEDIEKALTPPSEEKDEDGEKIEKDVKTGEESANDEPSSDDFLILGTEEGKYLATVLGDILIKGLTDVSAVRPPDPIGHLAHWLYQYLSTSSSSTPTSQEERKEGDGPQSTDLNQEVFDVHRRNLLIDSNSDGDSVRSMKREKDENGQTVLHFAASRPHREHSFHALVSQTRYLVAERDSQYKTARDIANDSDLEDNVATIDRFVVSAILEKRLNLLEHLVSEGYDNVLNITNNAGSDLKNILKKAGRQEMISILEKMANFQDMRKELHDNIFKGDLNRVMEILSETSIAKKLVLAKNFQGRSSAHVAILADSTKILKALVDVEPQLISSTDNMGRTPLHYAMGSKKLEEMGKMLIEVGADREAQDVMMRTPSYNLIDNSEIQLLKSHQQSLIGLE